jgi:hypothetical protein
MSTKTTDSNIISELKVLSECPIYNILSDDLYDNLYISSIPFEVIDNLTSGVAKPEHTKRLIKFWSDLEGIFMSLLKRQGITENEYFNLSIDYLHELDDKKDLGVSNLIDDLSNSNNLVKNIVICTIKSRRYSHMSHN